MKKMLNLKSGRTKDQVNGIKIGPINIIKGSYKGLVIGGINSIKYILSDITTVDFKMGSFTGGIFGIVNSVNHELKGIGMAFLSNHSQDLKGVESSLVNIVDRFMTGNQTGVINYSYDSYNSLQFGVINYSKGNGNDFPRRKKKESFWKAVSPAFQFGLININKNYHRNQLVIQLGGYCQIGNRPSIGLNICYEKAQNLNTIRSKDNELN